MNRSHIPHFVAAVLLGFVIHELAHFGMGRALGYDMWVSINKAGPAGGSSYTSEVHAQLVTVAGPVVTLLMAFAAFWLVRARGADWAFPYLFFAFMMRVMAAVVSLANPNDEAAVSAWLGIGTWTLPLVVVGSLFCMVLVASRRIELGWQDWLLSWAATSVGITLVVMTAPHWPRYGA